MDFCPLGDHPKAAIDDQVKSGYAIAQLASLKKATPLENLVGVHPMGPRNLGHTRTRFHRQLHNLQLPRNRPPPPAVTSKPASEIRTAG